MAELLIGWTEQLVVALVVIALSLAVLLYQIGRVETGGDDGGLAE